MAAPIETKEGCETKHVKTQTSCSICKALHIAVLASTQRDPSQSQGLVEKQFYELYPSKSRNFFMLLAG